MRILIVHNRYRSTAPSGENRVVDTESATLTALGHTVEHFERHSDDIEDWTSVQKATLPARVVWNPETRRDLKRVLREFRPDVVHVHNLFPNFGTGWLRDWPGRVVATFLRGRATVLDGLDRQATAVLRG